MEVLLFKGWLFFLWMTRVDGSGKIWKRDESVVNHRIMRIILESCYANESSSTPIVIIGNFNESLDELPIIQFNELYNSDEEIQHTKPFGKMKYAASKIILIEDSPTKLESDLTLLRSTKWWDHMALFFVIEKNPKTCGNFMDMLKITWKMDIFNCIYICTELDNTTAMYTFNPIANYAPSPWKRREGMEYLHMYHQNLDSNISCKNLHYDKTKILDGYEITMVFSDLYAIMPRMIYLNEFSEEWRFSPSYPLLHHIFTLWNVTALIEKVDYANDVVNRLEEGTADMSFDFYPARPPIDTCISTYYWSELIAIGKWRQEVSILTEIRRLWSPCLLIVGAAGLSILLIMLTIQNHNFFSSVWDLMRLLICRSILVNDGSHKFRICLSAMLILLVIINRVSQGFIMTFLIKSEQVNPPQTLNELAKLEYVMRVAYFDVNQVREVCPKCQLDESMLYSCIKTAWYEPRHACLLPKFGYRFEWETFKLDFFKKPAFINHEFFSIRKNWPLRNHFMRSLLRLSESGLLSFWMRVDTEKERFENQVREAEWLLPQYKPLKLNDLASAFQVLGLGLSISSILFFMELIVSKFVKYSEIKSRILRFNRHGNEMS